jgi:hypothetical protein
VKKPWIRPVEFELHRTGLGWCPDETTVTIHPYSRLQAAFVRARLKRWLATDYYRRPSFSGTEKVNAIMRMSRNLDEGPWKFTDVDLSVVFTVLAWSKVKSLDENEALRTAIFDAYQRRFLR